MYIRKLFIFLLALLIFENIAYAQELDFDRGYTLLQSGDFVQDKNFYFLTIIEQTPEIARIIGSDEVFKTMLEAKMKDMESGISDTFLGKMTHEILTKTNITTYIYRPVQPIATVKRHIVVVPKNAEYEVGFSFWLAKIWNIGLNTGSKVVFYATEQTTKLINAIYIQHPIDVEFVLFNDWDQLQALPEKIKTDDNITFVLSRAYHQSYHREMSKIPAYLDKHFQKKNFLLIYPIQFLSPYEDQVDLTNSSLLETIEKVEIIGKTIANIFRKK